MDGYVHLVSVCLGWEAGLSTYVRAQAKETLSGRMGLRHRDHLIKGDGDQGSLRRQRDDWTEGDEGNMPSEKNRVATKKEKKPKIEVCTWGRGAGATDGDPCISFSLTTTIHSSSTLLCGGLCYSSSITVSPATCLCNYRSPRPDLQRALLYTMIISL